ncbi:MAG: nitroreductase family protein [Lachnospiraceae bacterium]|nr:nitroreductase family protein [Lachnospiraceae bacterium]
MSTVTEAITKRSSTRGYTNEPLTKEELDLIIEAGLKAPTGANKQELHFSVLQGDHPILKELEDAKNAMRGLKDVPHNFYYEAPTIIFISADKEYRWSEIDAGIAVENMALTAEELGLGNLIIGCVFDVMRGEDRAKYEAAMKFPKGYEYEIAIAVGHKAVEKVPHTYNADAQVTYIS